MVIAGRLVEGDTQPDLDVPAGDLDVFDEQPQKGLALGVVEFVDDGADAVGEVLDALAEPVASGEVGALGFEAAAFLLGVALACSDRGGAALPFGHVDQPGLVGVDQPVVLGAGGLEPAVQAGQFGGEQLVVGDGGVYRDGLARLRPALVRLQTAPPGRRPIAPPQRTAPRRSRDG